MTKELLAYHFGCFAISLTSVSQAVLSLRTWQSLLLYSAPLNLITIYSLGNGDVARPATASCAWRVRRATEHERAKSSSPGPIVFCALARMYHDGWSRTTLTLGSHSRPICRGLGSVTSEANQRRQTHFLLQFRLPENLRIKIR